VMPVFSSGQSAKQAPGTYAALGSTDLIVTAGGGIMGHPNGATAGVAALREAWEAAVQGISLVDYARQRPALAKALESAP
jgi:ribulose-bisphosphate carboxylase large chain